jgi:hypothetical protein
MRWQNKFLKAIAMLRLWFYSITFIMGVFMSVAMTTSMTNADDLNLTLRYRAQAGALEPFRAQVRNETWLSQETAIIVCDFWDLHHCLNAVERIKEFGPRLNLVLQEARRRGVTIIHAPSDCMPHYAGHPARQRAMDTPQAVRQRFDVTSWCSRVTTEAACVWPIDQSDGGEDDLPESHARWVDQLKAMGRNPGTPWKMQSDLIDIDQQRDFLSDRGDEVWNI